MPVQRRDYNVVVGASGLGTVSDENPIRILCVAVYAPIDSITVSPLKGGLPIIQATEPGIGQLFHARMEYNEDEQHPFPGCYVPGIRIDIISLEGNYEVCAWIETGTLGG
jgi:hypothetical protein